MWRTVKALTLTACIFLLGVFGYASSAHGSDYSPLLLQKDTQSIDVYSSLYLIKDLEKTMTIDGVAADENVSAFIPAEELEQKMGFFHTAKWLRFEVENDSDETEWLLELAFPLIYEIRVYTKKELGLEELYVGGANYPFHTREIKHRHFIYKLDVPRGERKTYFIGVHSTGDLHPPIKLWNEAAFIEKTQQEFVILGVFYGMIIIMIFYNLFLFFSLRMKSYLYYVFVITCTLIGQMSINGMLFPYLWPNSPTWNAMSTPFWVSLACVFILLFTRSFLETNRHIPGFKKFSCFLTLLNVLVIFALPFSLILALNMMLFSTICTFTSVLTVAFISLKRGIRQARFFVAGWIVFLVGVLLTIFERAGLLPFMVVTDYAGQTALVLEVALLSLALADKINILRDEKDKAEQKALESEALESANRELEKLNENLLVMGESRRNLLANIAHELATPVTLFDSYIQALQEGIVSLDNAHFTNLVADKINVLNRLINDLSDLSNLEAGQASMAFVDIDAGIWLGQMIERFRFEIEQLDRGFTSDCETGSLNNYQCKIDRDRMHQVFSNLIRNAVKFTSKEKGMISVTAHLDEKHRLLVIQMKDNGIGIKEEDLSSIFERLYTDSTGSANGNGRGLGLAIVREIIHAHQGRITVESEFGKGTIFSIALPVMPRAGHLK
ncbi:sensor histidine kinase [Sporosarcina oncorhynchi]|uniref:histidine kinase n=1 Tax=Sporosarcina oncorhynchi TaxID=3056444 RepID=A0ABZ0L686_9BACL|nr:sensor histidine kinase [Sporosarcina sp. T2O-4]WOV87674.1 sensor histidine kinase [Sporosarcina sp. T2O-4]